MNAIQNALYLFVCNLVARQEGQDLVEYSLVISMIGLGCVFGMGSLATGVDVVFSSVASTMTTNV